MKENYNITNREKLSDTEIESFKNYSDFELRLKKSNQSFKGKWFLLLLMGIVLTIFLINFFNQKKKYEIFKGAGLTYNDFKLNNKKSSKFLNYVSDNDSSIENTFFSIAGNNEVTDIKAEQVNKDQKFKNLFISWIPNKLELVKWQEFNDIYIKTTNPDVHVTYVKGKNIRVKKLGKDKFRLYPDTSKNGGEILVYCENDENIQVLQETKYFEFVNPELPVLSLNGKSNGEKVLIEELLNHSLEAYHKNERVEVLSFTFIYKEIGLENRLYQNSRKLNLSVRNIIRKQEPGDKIRFENIKIKLYNGYIETIPKLEFEIREKTFRD